MTVNLVITGSDKTSSLFASRLEAVSGQNGVCVLLTRRYSEIKPVFSKKDIRSNGFIFIDQSYSDEPNVIHTSLEDLTLLSITLNQAVQSLPRNNRFLAFDSFSALTLYNSARVVSKFAFFIVQQMREIGVDCLFVVGREGLDAGLLSTLKQCADKIEEK